LFALQTTENQATCQAGFATDKAQSDDKVIWDDDDEDDDAGSSAAAEGSGATYDDDGSEEQGESLNHSSKSPCTSSSRDWSEDDDDELESSAALGATTLHVAIAGAAGGKISPIVDVLDSPEQTSAAPKMTTLKRPGGRTDTAGSARAAPETEEDRAGGEGHASPQGEEGGQAPGYSSGWVSSSPLPSFLLPVLAFLTYLTWAVFLIGPPSPLTSS
jgi:hypothetical protein